MTPDTDRTDTLRTMREALADYRAQILADALAAEREVAADYYSRAQSLAFEDGGE